jgi:hypothetical protein
MKAETCSRLIVKIHVLIKYILYRSCVDSNEHDIILIHTTRMTQLKIPTLPALSRYTHLTQFCVCGLRKARNVGTCLSGKFEAVTYQKTIQTVVA